MAAKKARKSKKAPSAKQLAARRKFALAAKARSKAAKAKRPARKTAKKRNGSIVIVKGTGSTSAEAVLKARGYRVVSGWADGNVVTKGGKSFKIAHPVWQGKDVRLVPSNAKPNGKTVIKAKRVTILNLKKNPSYAIHKTLKATKRGNQAGWLLGTKFYAKSRGQKALPGGSVLDLNSGLVYSRVENPKRRKNIQMMAGGHPIRASVDYDPALAHESPSRSSARAQSAKRRATQKKIKAAGGVKKYIRKIKTRKAATRKASQSRRMAAATKARKATTTRLASRLLDRSGPARKTKRRNPRVSIDAAQKYDRALRWFVNGQITEAGLISRAKEYGYPIQVVRADIKAITGKSPKRSKKRNPNADTNAAYESFQGKPSTKSTSLNFPNGTPANVYKLGTLHSITLQSGAVVKPTGKTVWLCADTKGKLHLGTSGERLVNAPKGALGKVKEVEYITTKPHLGDNRPTRYYHELGEETGQKPTLYSDGNGGLLFKGGATYVRSDGIHN